MQYRIRQDENQISESLFSRTVSRVTLLFLGPDPSSCFRARVEGFVLFFLPLQNNSIRGLLRVSAGYFVHRNSLLYHISSKSRLDARTLQSCVRIAKKFLHSCHVRHPLFTHIQANWRNSHSSVTTKHQIALSWLIL